MARHLHAVRSRLFRRRDVPPQTDRLSLRLKSVTYVLGINCHPCVRNGPCHDESVREDLNHRPPGPEAATKGTDVRRNCSTHAVFWAVGVVPRELKSLRSSEELTTKLTPRATSWTDFRRSLFLHGLGAQTLRPLPPLAQCHLLATTKRCDRPKNVTPVRGLEPATPEPHANRQRTELRLSSRARLSPSTRGTNRAADGAGGAGWRSGRGTHCRTGHPGARSPGASPAS